MHTFFLYHLAITCIMVQILRVSFNVHNTLLTPLTIIIGNQNVTFYLFVVDQGVLNDFFE